MKGSGFFRIIVSLAVTLAAAAGISISAAAYDSDIVEPVHDFPYTRDDYTAALTYGDYFLSDNAYFNDEAGIFAGGTEGSEVFEQIQKTADATGMNIALFTGGLYRSDSVTEKFTHKAIEELFGTNWDAHGVFVYLDFEGHRPSYDFISTYHDAKLYYTDSETLGNRVEDIIQDMYKYLPASGNAIQRTQVRKAINVLLQDLTAYKEQGPEWEASYHNDEKGTYRYVFFWTILDLPFKPYKFIVVFFVISLVIAIAIAVANRKSIRKKYKFRETIKASAYTSQNRVRFNESQDIFLREHTTRTYVPRSSGGGGGHGGGGGGSHGGGGGHR